MKKGFSLVELSIVIIIIGLLFVGVSAGSSLIQQAKLRTIMNEMRMIETAIKTFVVAYDDLPGDMPNAYDIWGDDCGPNSLAGAGCNGNDNGIVGLTASIGFQPSQTERYRFWQHMSLAEVIDGSFTGSQSDSCFTSSTIPCHNSNNSFESRFSDGLLFVLWDFSPYPAASLPATWNTTNLFKIDLNTSGFTANDSGAAFTPQDLYNIDKKLDDGLPSLGTIHGGGRQFSDNSIESGCEKDVNGTMVYSLERQEKLCMMWWVDKRLLN